MEKKQNITLVVSVVWVFVKTELLSCLTKSGLKKKTDSKLMLTHSHSFLVFFFLFILMLLVLLFLYLRNLGLRLTQKLIHTYTLHYYYTDICLQTYFGLKR